MPDRLGRMYSPWPLLDGKPLNLQWGQIRSNQAETKAIVRQSFQELETGVDELNAVRALLGQVYGDIDETNRYRLLYDKDTEEFCLQRNDGFVDPPDWVDVWCIRAHDGAFQVTSMGGIHSSAGFYGPGLLNIGEVADSHTAAFQTTNDVSVTKTSKIFFDRDSGLKVDRILTGPNKGAPEVRFTAPFGKAQSFNASGQEWVINHSFGVTPLLVQVTDAQDRVIIPDKADLSDPDVAYFYFHETTVGKALIASGGLGAVELLSQRDPFYLTVRTNAQSGAGRRLRTNADLFFDSRYFYVNANEDEDNGRAHPHAFISLTAEALSGGGGSGSGGGSGFYGLNVGQADDTPIFSGITTLKFETESFYVTQNSPNIDEVVVNLRGATGGASDHGILTGLGDDDHPQYLLADGSRDLTGDLQVDGHSIIASGFYLAPGSQGAGYSLNIDDMNFDITIVQVENYWLENFVSQPYLVEDVEIITEVGSCTAAFYIHRDGERRPGVSVTGLDPISVTTTKTSAAATGVNAVGKGDSLVLSVPSNTTAKHLRGRLKIRYAG